MQQSKRITTAKDSLKCIEQGFYTLPDGRKINISKEVAFTNNHTLLLKPEDFSSLEIIPGKFNTVFSVMNETSIAACYKLSKEYSNLMCLNFASAKNPGGGFLGGAEAQEESLARVSALYPSLLNAPQYYEHHRKLGTCLYSDHMIYSPNVYVFKDEDGEYLSQPYFITFITSPAVNAGAITRNEPENLEVMEEVMSKRMRNMLLLASAKGHTNLILGAWGCGVFANDPEMIAGLFAHYLKGEFKGVFENIHFAVLSKNGKVIEPFENKFI